MKFPFQIANPESHFGTSVDFIQRHNYQCDDTTIALAMNKVDRDFQVNCLLTYLLHKSRYLSNSFQTLAGYFSCSHPIDSSHSQILLNSGSTLAQLSLNSPSTLAQFSLNSLSTLAQLSVNSRSTLAHLSLNSGTSLAQIWLTFCSKLAQLSLTSLSPLTRLWLNSHLSLIRL